MAIGIFKHPVRTLRQLLRIAKFCRKITPFYSLQFPRVFVRAVRLCNKERFLPDEAFRLGLFKPAIAPAELSKYISRKKLTKVQKALNPESWAPLLKNKGIFYRYCTDLGIPIPKLYAIFFRRAAGWASDGSAVKSRGDWQKFFDRRLPDQFVIKPAQGAYGKGLNVFSRTDKGFTDASGRSYKSDQLYDALLENPKHESFVIQEQLKNHPELIRLSGTQSLQTVRLISFVEGDGRSRILHAHFKPIIGRHLVDTFIDGLVGNVEAVISLDDGTLEPANQITATGSGAETINTHPKTKVSFPGFQLPLWSRTCSLVEETAPKFLPVRTIGWDVALTPNGPFIVEANIWWDPPNQHRCMDVILDALSGS